MLYNEFIQRYTNTPLDKRLLFDGANKMTLDDYYRSIKNLEDKIRPLKIEQEILLKDVEPLLK